MTNKEMREFLVRHKLDNRTFAGILGVTPSAVDHWCSGVRNVSLTMSRLCKTFDKYPGLLKDFGRSKEEES